MYYAKRIISVVLLLLLLVVSSQNSIHDNAVRNVTHGFVMKEINNKINNNRVVKQIME